MKLISLKCNQCGADVEVSENASQVRCQYCGCVMMVDDEVRRIEFDNPHKAGYQFEMGRIHAQREAASVDARAQQMYYELGGRPAEAGRTEKRKRHTFWWVMGWIFIFPIPVTILCIRSKKMKLWLKIPLILAAWAFYLLLASGKLGGS